MLVQRSAILTDSVCDCGECAAAALEAGDKPGCVRQHTSSLPRKVTGEQQHDIFLFTCAF